MTTKFQGYYAILDVKGTSVDVPGALAHAGQLLAAGPCCLQLRAKQLPLAMFCQLGHALRPLCGEHRVSLCVNDRLDVALAIGADVIHLGQTDLPLGEVVRVRKAARAEHLGIGISTHNLSEAKAAFAGGADHIGFGPVFPTQTKLDADPATGLLALAGVVAAVPLPVVAIGGINLDNVNDVVRTGASAAAVISAIDNAPDRTMAGKQVARAFAERR